MTVPFLINHLWQSSCFALLAGLLAFVLRKNSPKIRYAVWLSASLKFLVPFALLVSLGSVLPRPARHPVSVAAPVFSNSLVEIAEPFSPTLKTAVPAHAPLDWAPIAIGVVWALGFLAITLARCRSWRGVRAALRAGTPIGLPIPIRALITPGAEEPGIVGFLRPVLILPAQLLESLNPPQLGAILTHELCHVRRRDNLFAAVHMVVEAIFWFHPLIWWIGSRMVEERELACDEEVLRMGCEPADYVEGILKVCRFYTESPLPCISGVTGADVKKRLRAILAGSIADELGGAKRMILATIGLAALAAPVVVGVLNAPAVRAQDVRAAMPKFEVASIKPAVPLGPLGLRFDEHGGPGSTDPGIFDCRNCSLYQLVTEAYGITHPMLEFSGPDWLDSVRFDVSAKLPEGATKEQFRSMRQNLLSERFHLAVHREKKPMPVYELTVLKKGPKFKESQPGPVSKAEPGPSRARADADGRPILAPGMSMAMTAKYGALHSESESMQWLADRLTSVLHTPVIDHTGLKGTYDFVLSWANEEANSGDIAASNAGPGLSDAVQEQLGLKLEQKKGLGDVLVVDHIDKDPTGN